MARLDRPEKTKIINKYRNKKRLKGLIFILSLVINIYLGMKVYGG